MLELGVDGELVDQMEEISPDGPEYEELKACLLAKFPTTSANRSAGPNFRDGRRLDAGENVE